MSIHRDCNIRQMPSSFLYTTAEKAFINRMPKLIGTEWDKPLDYAVWKHGDGVKIDNLKAQIQERLDPIQNSTCAYCGLNLYATSGAQIEHIAPKGPSRYPQFMFTNNNLVLACSHCNGFEKKEKRGNSNTISKLNILYQDCLFNIVHPYFDNPAEHFDLVIDKRRIIISHLTLKGQKSIAIFELDMEPITSERGKVLFEKIYDFDPKFNKDFDEAVKRRGY